MVGKQNGSLKLADVESQLANTTRDTVNWQAKMRGVVANSIGEDDIKAIIDKQVEKAKAGSESAAKFVLTHVLGSNTPVTIRQTNIITDVETAARLARDARDAG